MPRQGDVEELHKAFLPRQLLIRHAGAGVFKEIHKAGCSTPRRGFRCCLPPPALEVICSLLSTREDNIKSARPAVAGGSVTVGRSTSYSATGKPQGHRDYQSYSGLSLDSGGGLR